MHVRQTIEAFGIPYVEYGHDEPEVEHNIDFSDGLDIFRISAMELVEYRSKSGVLTDAPHWLYGIRYARGTRELIWFEEDELSRPLPPEDGEF